MILPASAGQSFSGRTQEIGLAEVLVPPPSALVGKTVVTARFRSRNDLAVIGIKRGQTPLEGPVAEIPLRVGDTMLVVGPWRAIRPLSQGSDRLILLDTPQELDDVAPRAARAPQAVAILLLTVVLMASGIVPTLIGALVGCLLFGIFGCIDMNVAYRSIHWQTLILIVGMLPFSVALQETGGTQLAANWLLSVIGESSPRVVLTALFLTTAVLGLFISNTATAVLMAPVAIALASALGASPYPFAMTVALAASAAFMTPVSSPVNVLVLGPGNYSFFDFVRIGVPFGIIAMVMSALLVPILLPL